MKFLYTLSLLTLISCSAFDSSKHYFTENSVLIVKKNGEVRIENTLFKEIYSEGTIIERNGQNLTLQIISYKPKKEPEVKTIKVQLMPKQEYRYLK